MIEVVEGISAVTYEEQEESNEKDCGIKKNALPYSSGYTGPSQYEVQPNQISIWKKQLKEGVSEIFSKKRGKAKEESNNIEKRLYEEIGRLEIELDWLKKKSEPPYGD